LIHQPVTRLVSCQLVFPKGAIVFWFGCVPRAAMPETAIHKDGELEFWKNKVRLAEDFLMPPPADDFVSLE